MEAEEYNKITYSMIYKLSLSLTCYFEVQKLSVTFEFGITSHKQPDIISCKVLKNRQNAST